MNKAEIYNTLKTTQLHYALHANKLALVCEHLTGGDLETTKECAKRMHTKSVALLEAITDVLGNNYKGYKVMNTQNELLIEQWNELEKERLGL